MDVTLRHTGYKSAENSREKGLKRYATVALRNIQ